MAATAQAQAEALKATQRAGIEHAKQNAQRAYLGRKPSFTREQLVRVRSMLRQPTAGIAQIGKEGLPARKPRTSPRALSSLISRVLTPCFSGGAISRRGPKVPRASPAIGSGVARQKTLGM